jgi:hypothetical protein
MSAAVCRAAATGGTEAPGGRARRATPYLGRRVERVLRRVKLAYMRVYSPIRDQNVFWETGSEGVCTRPWCSGEETTLLHPAWTGSVSTFERAAGRSPALRGKANAVRRMTKGGSKGGLKPRLTAFGDVFIFFGERRGARDRFKVQSPKSKVGDGKAPGGADVAARRPYLGAKGIFAKRSHLRYFVNACAVVR